MKTKFTNLTISIFASSVMLITNVFAQADKATATVEKQALKAFKSQQYAEALSLYLELDKTTQDHTKYDYMIGMCYLSSDNKEKALPYLRAAHNVENASFVVNYYLGRAYLIEGNYTEAGNYLKIYLDSLNNFMSDANVKFKVKAAHITEYNKIHMEKTPEDVNKLIATCELLQKEQYEAIAQSAK